MDYPVWFVIYQRRLDEYSYCVEEILVMEKSTYKDFQAMFEKYRYMFSGDSRCQAKMIYRPADASPLVPRET